MPHAYVAEGKEEAALASAYAYAKTLGISPDSPDLVLLKHTLFSVEDARELPDIAYAAPAGEHKVIIITATRFFHEAQNALLKLFEEPPKDVTLILLVPSVGMLLPTLRSRLSSLSTGSNDGLILLPLTEEFLKADDSEREKLLSKLVDRGKSDKDAEKQQARTDAVRFAEDLLRVADSGKRSPDSISFIQDLLHFLPILHTGSAPLKLIFEHLLLVVPKGLGKRTV